MPGWQALLFDAPCFGGLRKTRIWGPSLRADVTRWLLSSNLAAEVRAELRPHPSGGPEPQLGHHKVRLSSTFGC